MIGSLIFPSIAMSACRYRINTYSVNFDGTAKYLSLTYGNQTGFDFTDGYTIEGWFYFNAEPTVDYYQLPFSLISSEGELILGLVYAWHQEYGEGVDAYWVSPDGDKQGTAILETNTWYHLAISVDQVNYTNSVYVDGCHVVTWDTDPYSYGNGDMYIGFNEPDSIFYLEQAEYFNGKIDDLRIWNYARTPEQIRNYKSVPIDIESGLAGSWHFNNDSYYDYSNNENNFTASGTPAANSLTGYDDKSLDFESTSEEYAYADFPTDAYPVYNELVLTGDATWETWLNFESLPTDGNKMFILSKHGNGTTTSSYEIWLENNSGEYRISLGLSANGSSLYANYKVWTPNTGTWYHLAITYDASEHSAVFYINGEQYGTAVDMIVTSIDPSATRFYIAANYGPGLGTEYGFFDGKMDEMRIWKRVLTEEEIDGKRAREIIGNETDIIGYWKFNRNPHDDGNDTYVIMYVGLIHYFANTLTYVNSPTYSDTIPFIKCRDQLIIIE